MLSLFMVEFEVAFRLGASFDDEQSESRCCSGCLCGVGGSEKGQRRPVCWGLPRHVLFFPQGLGGGDGGCVKVSRRG